MNKKTKFEKLFILLSGCVISLFLLCTTGCGGGNSCETISVGGIEQGNNCLKGISIPGLGGLFTSGKGCNSCLWSQSCKISLGSFETEDTEQTEEVEQTEETVTDRFIGCDNRYYGSGCMGCGYTEKSCYNGLVYETVDTWGFFYGSSESEEKMIGCVNGCFGCVPSDGFGEGLLKIFEIYEQLE